MPNEIYLVPFQVSFELTLHVVMGNRRISHLATSDIAQGHCYSSRPHGITSICHNCQHIIVIANAT